MKLKSNQLRLLPGVAAAAGLMALTTLAFGDGPGWTVNSTVQKLVVIADGGVNVRLSPELGNCASQGGYGPNYASIYASHPGINRIKADLLTAYLSGARVSLYLSDTNCKVTEIVLGGW